MYRLKHGGANGSPLFIDLTYRDKWNCTSLIARKNIGKRAALYLMPQEVLSI